MRGDYAVRLVILSRDEQRSAFTTADEQDCYRVTRWFWRLAWKRKTYVDEEAADV